LNKKPENRLSASEALNDEWIQKKGRSALDKELVEKAINNLKIF